VKDTLINVVCKNKETLISNKLSRKPLNKKKFFDSDSLNNRLMFAYILYPKSIINYLADFFNDDSYNYKLVSFLFFLIQFFFINFIIISLISVFILIMKVYREKKIKLLEDKYRELLVDYIFNEDNNILIPDEFQKIENNKFKRGVLLNQIMVFNKNLFGETKIKLRELYLAMKLNEDSIKSLNSNKWHIQAKGLRQLSQMNIPEKNNIIEEKINSKNDILSFEAQLAMVKLNHASPFSFLDKLKKYFPLWNQLNIHNTINANSFKVPEFSKWLSSENDYIVVFALRMIRIFQQQKAIKEILHLLNHTNESIKSNAIITLGNLRLNDALIDLRNIFNNEGIEIKILILKAIQNLQDESNIKFLGDALNDSDNNVKLEAAKALKYLGDIGINKLQMVRMTSNYENADIISVIDHVLDDRII
jgi:hypothetical protein